MDKIKCEFCERMVSPKGMHTHVQRSHGTPEQKAKYFQGNHGKYEQIKDKLSKSLLEYNKDKRLPIVNCKTCNKEFKITKTKQLLSGNYFCSRSCSSKRKKSQITKNKIQKTLKIIYNSNDKQCILCSNIVNRKSSIYCSRKCRGLARTLSCNWKESLREYRIRAKFNFSLNSYPDEFDFTLIKEYGWYKAANRGNNINGISRDHLFSIRDGFDNGINPDILAHPANCRLIRHSENASKHSKSILTLDELLYKIKEWDEKYK